MKRERNSSSAAAVDPPSHPGKAGVGCGAARKRLAAPAAGQLEVDSVRGERGERRHQDDPAEVQVAAMREERGREQKGVTLDGSADEKDQVAVPNEFGFDHACASVRAGRAVASSQVSGADVRFGHG